jgi:hypothetical protein
MFAINVQSTEKMFAVNVPPTGKKNLLSMFNLLKKLFSINFQPNEKNVYYQWETCW